MKLYVDDIRDAPDDSWMLAKSIDSAISFIERYGSTITHLSLDHDISIGIKTKGYIRPYPSPDTFKAVAKYAALYYQTKGSPPQFFTHSANTDGRREIIKILGDYGFQCTENPMPPAYRKN
jgi:hypothetical protein